MMRAVERREEEPGISVYAACDDYHPHRTDL